MWFGKKRRDAGYKEQQCFFCGTSSVILPPFESRSATSRQEGNAVASASNVVLSTGSPNNWFCSACHCQNTLAEDGRPADVYLRPMWDEEWNKDRSKLVAHTRPSAKSRASAQLKAQESLPAYGRSIFCHTCQTNQMLQVNMLADYLPDEAHPDYRRKLDQLAAYHASISERYPSVCSACAPRVQRVIHERDQYTRSWSLARWLELKQQASGSTESEKDIRPTPSHIRKRAFLGVPHNTGHTDHLRLALFVSVNVTTWCFYIASSLFPLDTVEVMRATSVQSRDQPFLLGMVITVALCAVVTLLFETYRYKPLQQRVERIRARSIRPDVQGRVAWQTVQAFCFYTRTAVIALFLLQLVSGVCLGDKSKEDEAWLVRRVASSLLGLELLLLVFVALRTRIVMPPELRLVSRPIVGHSDNTLLRAQQDDLLDSLTLDDDDTGSRPQTYKTTEESTLHHSVFSDDQDVDGDQVMEDLSQDRRLSHSSTNTDSDWPPRYRSNASNAQSVAYDFQLGPQKFWGHEKPTGLEEVFGSAISLNDDPATDSTRSSKWGQWLGFSRT